jgi:hypothetical protein
VPSWPSHLGWSREAEFATTPLRFFDWIGMTVFSCARCGYSSSAVGFFRREKVWYSPRQRFFCHGCAAYVPNREERLAYRHFPILLVLGVLAVEVVPRGPLNGLGYVFLFIASLVLWAPTVIVVHELGHALAGRLVGLRIHHVVLGTGPRLLWIRWNEMIVHLRTFPTGGFVVGYQPQPRPRRWRQAVFVTGGVLGNIAFIAAIVTAFDGFPSARHPTASVLFTMMIALIAAHVLTVIGSLRPRRLKTAAPADQTDGLILLNLARDKTFAQHAVTQRLHLEASRLSGSGRPGDACRHLEPGVLSEHPSPTLFHDYIFALAHATSPAAAIDFYFSSTIDLDRSATDDRGGAAYAYAMLAWIAIISRDDDLVAFAERMSCKAAALHPEPGEIDGTLGMAQIRVGNLAEGVPRALRVMRASSNETLRTEIALQLARAAHVEGNAELALEFTRLHEHLRSRMAQRTALWLRRAWSFG